MRAPAEKRDADKFVAEIVSIVGESSVEPFVRKLINDLRELREESPPFTGNQKDNEEFARSFRDHIDKLAAMLERAPDPVLAILFSPERFMSLLDWQGTAIGISPQVREYLILNSRRLTLFQDELNRLQAQCSLIIRKKLGIHGRVNTQKLHAAIAAREVLESAANQTGRKLSLSCSPTGKYCRIASLFFEATTGKQSRDMRRACETAAPPPCAQKVKKI